MMARKVRGKEVLDKAKDLVSKARTVEELRQAQAVILPLEFGLSLSQTADIIGVSKGWASRLRSEFIRAGGETKHMRSHGVRHRELMSRAEETVFLAPFMEYAKSGGRLIVSDIRDALQVQLGRTIALTSVYNLLHRHDWRKYIADKNQPASERYAKKYLKNKPRGYSSTSKIGGREKVESA
ncbi:MAG: winged helix-turn-helix domain-containing protein [Desulfuromonadales bacterium]|nr:winged helix-turn-helix domain-containing protein [Desulfuromonadales bacterium]